ncbi:hypothetical protein OH76DRAFT_1396798 [Lentinus brumalis]|uniref:Membrane anchor Opy2 N-terminal domain-containing protein n=1 Tax=Lentinus brumalis TaxID=2498619 RepID=A0A371DSA0_9APHY|nr:hypothetical protein OH76DRAFT_1396798 [Polyporus brumalis]
MLVGNLHLHHNRQANGTRDANGCLICTNLSPSCECGYDQTCVRINRDCNQCPYMQCIANDTSGTTTTKSGVSKGAVAGAVVVTILVLAATVAAYFWYRRRQRLQGQNTAPEQEGKPADAPARAEDVLNRPDPNEKPNSPPPQLNSVRIYSGTLHGTINLDPAASDAGRTSSGMSVHSNPFEDNHSIQTTSTGTQSNVIPIALVPPGSVGSGASVQSHGNVGQAAAARSDMNLDHVNVSNDSLGPRGAAGYAPSAYSGMDNGNNRMSYMTTGSYTSDFLETSVIVTPTRGTVKQVVGVAKAQVLSAPSSDNLSRSSTQSKPARSPLAASSFGPGDVMHEINEEQELTVAANPFSDNHSPYLHGSPTPSATTFGSPSQGGRTDSRADSNWLHEDPAQMYGSSNDERPASVYTQASAIVADISNARRVHLGFDQVSHMPQTPLSAALHTPRSPYRMTSAKLVSPVVHHSAALQTGGSSSAGALEAQQARALKELGAESGKRMSMSSVLTTSTRADSILESFPFVPPSPISNLPPRTPPRSPLNQQTFANAQDDHSQSARDMVNRARASASSSSTLSSLQPPNRKVLGMSVASQSSTVSNGLGSFPFQIDSGAQPEGNMSTAPSSFSGSSSDGSSVQRKRASLDTLALTSDLSSYPLGFDKTPPPPVPRR